jgi:hypothetical protein
VPLDIIAKIGKRGRSKHAENVVLVLAARSITIRPAVLVDVAGLRQQAQMLARRTTVSGSSGGALFPVMNCHLAVIAPRGRCLLACDSDIIASHAGVTCEVLHSGRQARLAVIARSLWSIRSGILQMGFA